MKNTILSLLLLFTGLALQAAPPSDKYKADDDKLGAAKAGEQRVIFFGDSITEAWNGADFFPGKGYINRGIAGQTTQQLLDRYQQDVLDLHPAVVLILAGTNDIAQNQGPITLEQIAANLESMAATAQQNHIKPVISSVLPALEYPWRKGLAPAEKIRTLNALLKSWCAKHGVTYLNYYPVLVASDHGMKPELAKDGIHPTSAGYALMSPLAEKAIHRALRN